MKKRITLDTKYEFLIDDAALLLNHFRELRISTQEETTRRLFAVDEHGKTQVLSIPKVSNLARKLKYNWLTTSPTRMEFLASIYEDRIYEHALLKKVTRREIRKCFAARRRLYNEYQITQMVAG